MKKAEKSRLLKAEERDTILAALRYYQRCFTGPDSRKVFQASSLAETHKTADVWH